MLKDAPPLQGCLTSNAFRMVPTLSLYITAYMYWQPSQFTALGDRE